jgi:hypothetical protein
VIFTEANTVEQMILDATTKPGGRMLALTPMTTARKMAGNLLSNDRFAPLVGRWTPQQTAEIAGGLEPSPQSGWILCSLH